MNRGESGGEVRLNPVWYRLDDLPMTLLIENLDATWHYVVTEEGEIRFGVEDVSSLIGGEERQRLDEGLGATGESFEAVRDRLGGQGHPTVFRRRVRSP